MSDAHLSYRTSSAHPDKSYVSHGRSFLTQKEDKIGSLKPVSLLFVQFLLNVRCFSKIGEYQIISSSQYDIHLNVELIEMLINKVTKVKQLATRRAGTSTLQPNSRRLLCKYNVSCLPDMVRMSPCTFSFIKEKIIL